jgi:hypothetical protein
VPPSPGWRQTWRASRSRTATTALPGQQPGPALLKVPALADAGAARAISGPLPPGQRAEDDVLSVTQTDAEHAEIVYGRSTIRFHATLGEKYAFVVGAPIPGPPKPPPEPPIAGGLIDR